MEPTEVAVDHGGRLFHRNVCGMRGGEEVWHVPNRAAKTNFVFVPVCVYIHRERRSKRTRKNRFPLHMSSTDTLAELKINIFQMIGVIPKNQQVGRVLEAKIIYEGATLCDDP